MQSTDIVQSIVAISSLIGVIVPVIKLYLDWIASRPRTKINKWIFVVIISGIVLVGNTGFWGWRRLGPTKVRITHPMDYGSVEHEEMIRGTSKRVPKQHAIWVVVFPHEANLYHPQNAPAEVQETGDWSTLVYIGTEKDSGKRFDIIAVVADKTAQDSFRAYLADGKKKDWPGLENLPEEATIGARITVTRR